jgi:hypothetical protein
MNDLEMNDLDAIRELVHRSADAVCRRDAEAWGATWAPDGIWDLGGGAVEGRDAVVASWVEAMRGFDAVVQTVLNGFATFTGDHGTGRWYLQEHLQYAGGEPGMLLASYDDEYARDADGWHFRIRRLTPYYLGPPDLTGRFMNAIDGSR